MRIKIRLEIETRVLDLYTHEYFHIDALTSWNKTTRTREASTAQWEQHRKQNNHRDLGKQSKICVLSTAILFTENEQINIPLCSNNEAESEFTLFMWCASFLTFVQIHYRKNFYIENHRECVFFFLQFRKDFL